MNKLVKLKDIIITEQLNKVTYRYEISDNLKKVSRIQKALIDVGQLITEMSDEIIALKANFSSSIEPDRLEILDNMQRNLSTLNELLNGGKQTDGMMYVSRKLQKNLEKLKRSYLSSSKK